MKPEVIDVGPHRVRHGNVMDADLLPALDLWGAAGERARLMYSDPPWGQGNLRYWQTLNRKMNPGDATALSYEAPALADFLDRIFAVAQNALRPDGLLLVEYGVRWDADVLAVAATHGFARDRRVTTLYRGGRDLLPLHLHLFRRADYAGPHRALPVSYATDLAGTHGYETVRRALAPLADPGEIILDPCCGMGYTAQAAVDFGMRFRGNELNRARLEKTLTRLRRAEAKAGQKGERKRAGAGGRS